MAEIQKKFGKYFLLDLLAQGGMAEIYRARHATPDGGGRLLAIKRIIPSYSQNAEFVTMFRSEIKTTSGFTHPNIVQVYDYGEEQGMLYIAMELVDGKNLRQFITRFQETKQRFPVEVAVYIAEQAARALSYAHNFKDKITNKSLNLVHRDISPQNILISYDGAVKVIDFGIAKAVTNMESTRSGVIKGKPSYLSPEQISGETLDGRSDIFALGIVLWELLSGRKLFAGDNDYGVIRLIENCTNHVKPPSTFNPDVPKELDSIVMKCLQKNRDQRYPNTEEMQRALHRFLYQFSSEFNPADLAYYARDFFKDEIVEDRKKLFVLNEKAERLMEAQVEEKEKTTTVLPKLSEPTLNPPPPPSEAAQPKKGTKSGSFRMISMDGVEKSKISLERENPTSSFARNEISKNSTTNTNPQAFSSGNTRSQIVRPKPQTQSKPISKIAVLLALGILGGASYYIYNTYVLGREIASKASPVATGVLVVEGNLKAATVVINERQVAQMLPATVTEVPADQTFRLVVSANGYKRFTQDFSVKSGETKKVVVSLIREDPNAPQTEVQASSPPTSGSSTMIPLRLNILPAGPVNKVTLNGALVDPLTRVANASLDTNLELVIERDGFRTYRQTFRIDSGSTGDRKEWPIDVALEPAKFGFLSIKTTPSAEAIINVDGIEEKIATPFSRKRLPVGTYSIKLVNTLLGMEKNISVTVGEEKFTNIEERLSVQGDNRQPSSQ